jgi:hypothetical protein
MDKQKILLFLTIMMIFAAGLSIGIWLDGKSSQKQEQSIQPLTVESKKENVELASKFIYAKNYDSFFLSNFDGSEKFDIAMKNNSGVGISVSQTGKIAYIDDNIIKVKNNPQSPHRNIFSVPEGRYLKKATISPNGEKIAYVMGDNNNNNNLQLWIVNSDGTNNQLIFDDVDLSGPDFLVPERWSMDNTKIYLETANDGVESDAYLYAILDVPTKTIQKLPFKIETDHENSYNGSYFSFSQDNKKLAFVEFDKTDEGVMSSPIPPYKLKIVGLATLAVEETLSNQKDLYEYPSWSPDGKKISYKLNNETWIFDIVTKEKTLSAVPINAWLSNDRIIYVENSDSYANENVIYFSALYSSKIDGTEKKLIDSLKSGSGSPESIHIVNLIK